MDKFKKFLKGKKVDKHFKKQGQGARLGDGNAGSSQRSSMVHGSAQDGSNRVDRVAAADVAAQAAYQRMLAKEEPVINHSQKKIRMLAKQELEKEKLQQQSKILEEQMDQLRLPSTQIDEREFQHSNVIKGVFYTCDLLPEGTALEKQELHGEIEEFLRQQIIDTEEDAVIPAVMMLYTLNKNDTRMTAVDTICTYLKNIAEFPEEPKYRRIRLTNKAFQERVLKAIGGLEILQAVGFREVLEGESAERFLVIAEEKAIDTGKICAALDTIRNGERVPIRVARDTRAFRVTEGAKIPSPHLPLEFFDLTSSELAREQQLLKEQADRMTLLRTREMRERDNVLRHYKYKYTLIRIRFPDRFVIQGTFGIYEPIQAMREWIADHVAHPTIPFNLKCANQVLDNDAEMLGDAKLAPCAVIHLEWSEPVNGPSLKDNLLAEVQPLDS